MERFGPRGNFPEKVVHLFEVALFDQSVRSDRNLQFHFQNFSFPVPLHWEVIEILAET